MKAFIDLGAYTGDTIQQFHSWMLISDNPNKYTIYAFEPNPDLTKQMKDVASQYKNVIFKPWAAWIFDGRIEFAKDQTATPMGSTVMESKAAIWDIHPHVKVKCFNFPQWLKQMFKEDDEVIVKMDIEGAEFPILEAMLANGSITIPKKLLVEFHANKVQKYTSTYRNNLIKRIKKAGGNLELWH